MNDYEVHGQSEYLSYKILCQNVKTFKKNSVLHVFFLLGGNGPLSWIQSNGCKV